MANELNKHAHSKDAYFVIELVVNLTVVERNLYQQDSLMSIFASPKQISTSQSPQSHELGFTNGAFAAFEGMQMSRCVSGMKIDA
jgi:hypothetical protein